MAGLAALILLLAGSLAGAPGFPKGFTVPADFQEDTARRRYWEFDTAQFDFFPANERNWTHQKVEGHLWRTALSAAQFKDGDALISVIASAFEKDGWKILRRQGAFVARKTTAENCGSAARETREISGS